jgi:hypothetical protein
MAYARDAVAPLVGWAGLLQRATRTFSDLAGSDRISFVDMDRLATSPTERAMHTETSLLDMDLVRGSSMRKRWVDRRLNSDATRRVILMPLHARFWAAQLSWAATAPLTLLWLLYASLLYARSVQPTVWLPGRAERLELWTIGEGNDLELFAPAVMLIILGLTTGAYVVSIVPAPMTSSTRSPRFGATDGAASHGSKGGKLGDSKPGPSSIDETDTDSSASDSSADSDTDDEDVTEARAHAPERARKPPTPTTDGRAGGVGYKPGRGVSRLDDDAASTGGSGSGSSSASGRQDSSVREPLNHMPTVASTMRQGGSPPGMGRASISSRGAVRLTIWEQATEEERNMPFVVGERAGSKRYMDLQDIGRIIGQRVREKQMNTQYLRAAAAWTIVIVMGPLLRRLQPELVEIWGELTELELLLLPPHAAAAAAAGSSAGAAEGYVAWGWHVAASVCGTLAAHIQKVPVSTVCATVVCLAAKAVCTAGLLLHLAVAERCESQRCLKAKYFTALTSRGKSRRVGTRKRHFCAIYII